MREKKAKYFAIYQWFHKLKGSHVTVDKSGNIELSWFNKYFTNFNCHSLK